MTSHSLSCTSYLYTATPPTAIVVATPAILTSQLLVISCRSPPVDFCSALSICQLSISPMERRDRRDSAYTIVERYQRLLLLRYVRLGSRFSAFVSILFIYLFLSLSASVSVFYLRLCLSLYGTYFESHEVAFLSLCLSSPPPLARLTKNSTVRIKKRTGWRILHDHVETLDLVSNYTQNLVLVLFAPSLPPFIEFYLFCPLSLSLSRFFDTRPSIQVSCD